MPLFSDATSYATIVKVTMATGDYPRYDPNGAQAISVGRVTDAIQNKYPNVYPPTFFIMAAIVGNVIIDDIQWSVKITSIMSHICLVLITYLITRKISGNLDATLLASLTSMAPFTVYFVIHANMELLLILSVSLLLYAYMSYVAKKSVARLLLCSLFIAHIISIKQSGYVFVLAILVHFLLSCGRAHKKHICLLVISSALLSAPVFIFHLDTMGTIFSYPTSNPIINSVFPNSYWQREKPLWEERLDKATNFEKIYGDLVERSYEEANPYLFDLIRKEGYQSALQRYSFLPIFPDADQHFYSTKRYGHGAFFFLFVMGIVSSLLRNDDWDIRLLFAILFVSSILGWGFVSPSQRYFFFFTYTFSVYAFRNILSIIRFRYIRILLLMVIIVCTSINLASKIDYDLNYQYTILHTKMWGTGGGVPEIMRARGFAVENIANDIIFSQSQQFAYYWDKKIIWDPRLFYIQNETQIVHIFADRYNTSYVVIPTFTLDTNKKSFLYIPHNSTFYEMLINQRYFRLLGEFESFYVFVLEKE